MFYVILHPQVSQFKQGEVRDELEFQTGTEFSRLVLAGAIRPAFDGEVGQKHVDIHNALAAGSNLQERANATQNEAVKLMEQVKVLTAENEKLKKQKDPEYDPTRDAKMAAFTKDRDEVINQQHKRLTDQDQEIASLNRKLQEKHGTQKGR